MCICSGREAHAFWLDRMSTFCNSDKGEAHFPPHGVTESKWMNHKKLSPVWPKKNNRLRRILTVSLIVMVHWVTASEVPSITTAIVERELNISGTYKTLHQKQQENVHYFVIWLRPAAFHVASPHAISISPSCLFPANLSGAVSCDLVLGSPGLKCRVFSAEHRS